jgi:hypothetical protein
MEVGKKLDQHVIELPDGHVGAMTQPSRSRPDSCKLFRTEPAPTIFRSDDGRDGPIRLTMPSDGRRPRTSPRDLGRRGIHTARDSSRTPYQPSANRYKPDEANNPKRRTPCEGRGCGGQL